MNPDWICAALLIWLVVIGLRTSMPYRGRQAIIATILLILGVTFFTHGSYSDGEAPSATCTTMAGDC
jgi:hypothetical protein